MLPTAVVGDGGERSVNTACWASHWRIRAQVGPYDQGVDPTTQAALAAVIGAIVAGGAVLAWHISDRQQSQRPRVGEPLVPPGVAAVLAVLRSSAVVVDQDDHVLKASAPAYALGLVRGSEGTHER